MACLSGFRCFAQLWLLALWVAEVSRCCAPRRCHCLARKSFVPHALFEAREQYASATATFWHVPFLLRAQFGARIKQPLYPNKGRPPLSNAQPIPTHLAVLLINTIRKQAKEVAATFHRALENHNLNAKRGYDILFSHGIVEFDPAKHPTIEALLAEGDAAMYEFKRSKG
ncbi:MAG: diguanylate cyclase [Burkholderiaceae bacterium]|nr:MAG: diguanylate cyclase [Burkholderiaceae bacterium]